MADADLAAVWAPFLRAPDRAAVVTDFDGTLAPIVDDPSRSRPLPEAVEVLHRLSERYGLVGVVSGRPAGFIAEHLHLATCADEGGCEGLRVSGLYGLETAHGNEVTPHPDAEQWRRPVDEMAALAEKEAPEGVTVEHKGLSLTLHYRTAPDQEDWVRDWVEEHALSSGLAAHPARMSQELRPPMETDKGTALSELVADLDVACFAGDDSGDLPAFAALDRLSEDQGMTVVKIAVRSDESPSELLEQADVEVDGPEGMVELFRGLL